MLVSELNRGSKLTQFVGARATCADPQKPINVLVIKSPAAVNPHSHNVHQPHISMHRNLWMFILENENKGKSEFINAKYEGVSRLSGNPILSYSHGSFEITLKQNKTRLEHISISEHLSIINKNPDYKQEASKKAIEAAINIIELKSKETSNKLLLLL